MKIDIRKVMQDINELKTLVSNIASAQDQGGMFLDNDCLHHLIDTILFEVSKYPVPDSDDENSIRHLCQLFDIDMEQYGKDEDEMHELYDAMLDEVYDAPSVGNCSMLPSKFLKDNDPTAYRCGFSDWLDSERDSWKEFDNRYLSDDDIQEIKDEIVSKVEDIDIF